MSIPVKCTCGKKYSVADELAGKLVYCPHCKLSLDIPAADLLPSIDDIEVMEEEEAPGGPKTYGMTEAEDDYNPLAAAAAASGFAGSLGRVKTKEEVSCLAYGGQNRFALAGVGRDVVIFDARGHKKVGRCEAHHDPVTCLGCAAAHPLALSGDSRGELLLWQIEGARVVRTLRGHRGAVQGCAIAPNGKYAISGGNDGTVRMWDFASGQEISLFKSDWDEAVTAVAYSHDGKHIAAGGERGKMALWSVRTGERLFKFQPSRAAIESVGFSPDNSELIGAGFTKASRNGLMAWRYLVHNGEKLPTFTNPSEGNAKLFCLRLTPNGRRIVVGYTKDMSRDAGIDVAGSAAATGGAIVGNLLAGAVLGGDVGEPSAVLVFRGGEYSEECGLQTYTVEGGVRGQSLSGVKRPVVEVAVSPDSTRALAALEDGDLAFFALPP